MMTIAAAFAMSTEATGDYCWVDGADDLEQEWDEAERRAKRYRQSKTVTAAMIDARAAEARRKRQQKLNYSTRTQDKD